MFMDPAKLLVIAVVALAVLGPDHLPKMAKSAGSLWRDLSRLRAKLDEQAHEVFPDLPDTKEIVRVVRAPMSLVTSFGGVRDEEPSWTQAQTRSSSLPQPHGEALLGGTRSSPDRPG
jgi:Sec-independent protein translocase protein TatA